MNLTSRGTSDRFATGSSVVSRDELRRSALPLESEDGLDQKLFTRMAGGDESALGEFFDRWSGSLQQTLVGLRLLRADADEIVEEVFRRMWFEAASLAARPETFSSRFHTVIRECCSAIVVRRRLIRHAEEFGSRSDAVEMQVAALQSSTAVKEFAALLERVGVAPALSFLNSRTPFRFTGIYRFDGLDIVNLYLHDREGQTAQSETPSPVSDTYCVWVQETLSVVRMTNSALDPRARHHAKREQIRSYCGYPIKDANGNLFGTICHFDYVTREIPADATLTLAEVAPILARIVAG